MSELLGKFFGKDKHGSSSQNKDKLTTSSGSHGGSSAGSGGGAMAAAGDRNSSPAPTGQQQQLAGLPRGPILPSSRNPVEFSKCMFSYIKMWLEQ